ncbi:solute carrier family 22 member 13-like [Solea senegalensis]|uniref:Solute carrier family 22 member 13-like n=1 Tax=Solea senegalensis TaxID=28829 RepID=A0AAV6TAV7_SOLSE|nr:solute carrier family 22 member 13-like [Solea senegalensis]
MTASLHSEDTDTNMSNFEQILKEIGEFGLFQKILVAALCIPSIFLSFDLIGQVFTGMNFPHHCNNDWILAQATNLTEGRRNNLSIPLNNDRNSESCEMFIPADLETSEAYGVNTTTGCINGSVYETPEGASSIVTEVRDTWQCNDQCKDSVHICIICYDLWIQRNHG